MNDQTDGIAGHPYATTRTRTYTKGGEENARIDKARTDKGRNHHISKHRSTKARYTSFRQKKRTSQSVSIESE